MSAPIEGLGAAQPLAGGLPQNPYFPDEPIVLPQPPVNPYAPTGWKKKQRVEFDLELPSGQLARVMRLERDDLFRLNLMEYLDTFTPMLLDDTGTAEERTELVKQTMSEKPEALTNMLTAIDKVVMSATIRPQITDIEASVNYGTEKDWADPNFTATVYINDIEMEERMYIFGAAFGRSIDDLKSIWPEAQGMGSLDDVPVVPQNA